MDRMNHYTITVPSVTNDGAPSDYAALVRDELLSIGIDGWTETLSVGFWHGRAEAGIVFTLYLMPSTLVTPTEVAVSLGKRMRRIMPDQEAIQVTYHGSIVLVEG